MDADGMNKRFEEALAKWNEPVILPTPSGDWISCREARELIWKITGEKTRGVAEKALARRSDIIPTKILRWIYSSEPQEGIPLRSLSDEPLDLSDWSTLPSRSAIYRRWSVLSRIGDDVNDSILIGSGLMDACWITGDFTVLLDGNFRRETVTLIGLMFDPEVVSTTFNATGLEGPFGSTNANASVGQGSSTILSERNVGGRPASRHGEVIAAVTLRLSKLDPVVLRTYTAEALASELEQDYRGQNETPPAPKSRLLYASGILRIIRAHQS